MAYPKNMQDEEFSSMIKMVAPGTKLRMGIDNVLRAKTGALIVVGESEDVLGIVDGGFNINCELTPARIYELAKMDGAILLNSDANRILVANAHLVPDPSIPSRETGIRHRTAERVAKQTQELVISISQRRDTISLFWGNYYYVLEEIDAILNKANQALRTLEKYRNVLDRTVIDLNALEFEDLVTVSDIIAVLQRGEMVLRIQKEVERYALELGDEGRLIRMQLDELVAGIYNELLMLIRDYAIDDDKDEPTEIEEILEDLMEGSGEDLIAMGRVSKGLGFSGSVASLDDYVCPRGYRLLRKIPRMPLAIIENLIQGFGRLSAILAANIEELDEVDGIGEVRARSIKEGLRRLREQALLDRHI